MSDGRIGVHFWDHLLGGRGSEGIGSGRGSGKLL